MSLDTLRLPVLAIICGLLLSIAFTTLRPSILENQQEYEARQLLDIVQAEGAEIREVLPGVFAVSQSHGSRTWIFDAETQEGYNGRISLWVGISDAGVIQGVRIRDHEETPGLGDKIELAVSDWILSFDGYGTSSAEQAWNVKREGGDFDQFTGATITPRAVVHAVRDALAEFELNRDQWAEAEREL